MEQDDDRTGGMRRRTRTWVDERGRSTSFVPPTERVVLDARRHPVMLVLPALRTLAGLLVLLPTGSVVPLLALGAATALWARGRLRAGLRRAAGLGAGVAVALLALEGVLGAALCVLALVAWLLEDVADWWTDRLVVSERRIYRRYGVVTRHSPSIALTAIAFLDASVPPLGRALHYGTLRLDSLAQRDAPLSRFDLLPDVVALSHEILRLRAAAMPKFPQQPL